MVIKALLHAFFEMNLRAINSLKTLHKLRKG